MWILVFPPSSVWEQELCSLQLPSPQLLEDFSNSCLEDEGETLCQCCRRLHAVYDNGDSISLRNAINRD